MDSLLKAATPALEVAAMLVDPGASGHPDLRDLDLRDLACTALGSVARPTDADADIHADIHADGSVASEASFADVRLALAALLDELALRHHGALADRWRQGALLQQRFVHPTLTTAGNRFFERLEELLCAPRSAAILQVLRIYAICLQLGFKGCFSAQDEAARLLDLRARVQARLGTFNPPSSADPSAQRSPHSRSSLTFAALPRLALLGITATLLALAMGHLRLEQSADKVREHIDSHRAKLLRIGR